MVSMSNLFITLSILLISVHGNMTTFDCPMRELALQYAQYIQPHLSMEQLQQIADALNGSPEAQNCNIKPSHVFTDIITQIPKTKTPSKWNDIDTDNIKIKLYVSDKYGSDTKHSGLSIEKKLEIFTRLLLSQFP